MMTHGFNTGRRFGQHKLRTRTHAKGADWWNSFPFCPRYDKGCSIRRVATLSFPAVSTAGVTVDQHNNVNNGN